MKGYPKWFLPGLLTIFILLFVTGCLLVPTLLELRLEWNVSWRLGSDQRIWVAALHAFLSFLTLTIVGALAEVHMRIGWHRRRNYRSGFWLVGIMAVLLLTAMGIYYLGEEKIGLYASLIHLFAGLVAFLFSLYHILNGRRITASAAK